MNANEYGIVFRMSTDFDMSSKTFLEFTFTRPDATTFLGTATVGSGNITTTLGVFVDKKYANYTFLTGDINQAGLYGVRLTYRDAAPKRLISDAATFTVNP